VALVEAVRPEGTGAGSPGVGCRDDAVLDVHRDEAVAERRHERRHVLAAGERPEEVELDLHALVGQRDEALVGGGAVEGGDELLGMVVVADAEAELRRLLGGAVEPVGDVGDAVGRQPALGSDERVDDRRHADLRRGGEHDLGAGSESRRPGPERVGQQRAWPVGDASPLASRAARISVGRETKSNASTLRRPMAASLSSEPPMSAVNSLASVYSWTEATGSVMTCVLRTSLSRVCGVGGASSAWR
jgi:hypothetical protein